MHQVLSTEQSLLPAYGGISHHLVAWYSWKSHPYQVISHLTGLPRLTRPSFLGCNDIRRKPKLVSGCWSQPCQQILKSHLQTHFLLPSRNTGLSGRGKITTRTEIAKISLNVWMVSKSCIPSLSITSSLRQHIIFSWIWRLYHVARLCNICITGKWWDL